jgi:hypothetical protein
MPRMKRVEYHKNMSRMKRVRDMKGMKLKNGNINSREYKRRGDKIDHDRTEQNRVNYNIPTTTGFT